MNRQSKKIKTFKGWPVDRNSDLVYEDNPRKGIKNQDFNVILEWIGLKPVKVELGKSHKNENRMRIRRMFEITNHRFFTQDEGFQKGYLISYDNKFVKTLRYAIANNCRCRFTVLYERKEERYRKSKEKVYVENNAYRPLWILIADLKNLIDLAYRKENEVLKRYEMIIVDDDRYEGD